MLYLIVYIVLYNSIEKEVLLGLFCVCLYSFIRVCDKFRPENRVEGFFSGFSEVVCVIGFGDTFPEEHWTPFDCKEGVRGHFSHFV